MHPGNETTSQILTVQEVTRSVSHRHNLKTADRETSFKGSIQADKLIHKKEKTTPLGILYGEA